MFFYKKSRHLFDTFFVLARSNSSLDMSRMHGLTLGNSGMAIDGKSVATVLKIFRLATDRLNST
jgi:hypothetical protein